MRVNVLFSGLILHGYPSLGISRIDIIRAIHVIPHLGISRLYYSLANPSQSFFVPMIVQYYLLMYECKYIILWRYLPSSHPGGFLQGRSARSQRSCLW
jgi:hypothetical protein